MENSLETRIKELETANSQMRHFLFGNGQPGFVSEIRDSFLAIKTYIAAENAAKGERNRIERKHGAKQNLIIALCTMLFVALSSIAAILALREGGNDSLLRNLSGNTYLYASTERN